MSKMSVKVTVFAPLPIDEFSKACESQNPGILTEADVEGMIDFMGRVNEAVSQSGEIAFNLDGEPDTVLAMTDVFRESGADVRYINPSDDE